MPLLYGIVGQTEDKVLSEEREGTHIIEAGGIPEAVENPSGGKPFLSILEFLWKDDR